MGNSLISSDNKYYIYRRQLSNDNWVKEPVIVLGNKIDKVEALSFFKHELYCFGIENTKYDDTKAIYLYHGNQRIVKAIRSKNNQIEIWSNVIRQFLKCSEKSSQAGRQIKYERLFYNKYVASHAWIDLQTVAYALI
jgi:hypothetical protein